MHGSLDKRYRQGFLMTEKKGVQPTLSAAAAAVE